MDAESTISRSVLSGFTERYREKFRGRVEAIANRGSKLILDLGTRLASMSNAALIKRDRTAVLIQVNPCITKLRSAILASDMTGFLFVAQNLAYEKLTSVLCQKRNANNQIVINFFFFFFNRDDNNFA